MNDGNVAEPSIYVGPEKNQNADPVMEAVESGGGRITSSPDDAEAIVWLGGASGLSEVLHEGVRWVQLPSAGVEAWMESGVIDGERLFTSAVGAYAGTVA